MRSRLHLFIVGGALLPSATTLSTSAFAPRVVAARSVISMAATEAASEASEASEAVVAPEEDTIVQFVVIRKDLLKTLEWPTGSVVAQACHACTAVIWTNQQDPCVQEYLSAANVESMHKVLAQSAWPTRCRLHITPSFMTLGGQRVQGRDAASQPRRETHARRHRAQALGGAAGELPDSSRPEAVSALAGGAAPEKVQSLHVSCSAADDRNEVRVSLFFEKTVRSRAPRPRPPARPPRAPRGARRQPGGGRRGRGVSTVSLYLLFCYSSRGTRTVLLTTIKNPHNTTA